MDPNRLRAMNRVSDGPEMQRVWDLMFSLDRLTLAEAVKVMGREPRSSNDRVFVWDKEDIFVVKSPDEQKADYVVVRHEHWYLPTVGQFACLVLAAKMGEQA